MAGAADPCVDAVTGDWVGDAGFGWRGGRDGGWSEGGWTSASDGYASGLSEL